MSQQVIELPLAAIEPGANDRTEFAPGPLLELAQSIARHGLAQPITVRPRGAGRYQIVAGERRWRAHKLYTERVAGGDWPASAKCRPGYIAALVRELTDEEASAIMLAENDQREDLSPLDRARAYRSRMEQFGWDVARLAETVKKSERTIRSYLDLLALEPFAQKAVQAGSLPLGHAQLLAPLDADRQRLALKLLAKGARVTYEMFREYVNQLLEEQSQQAMFDLTSFWVAQVNEAEAKRQGISYDLPTSDDLPAVVIEARDNASKAIRRYIADLLAAGHRSEAAAVGNVMTALLRSRKLKS